MAGVVTAIGPLGTVGWGSAPGALGGFGSQGLLVLPPLPVPPPVPGGTLLLPRRRAAAAQQPALVPQRRELLLDHVPHGDVDRGARRVLVGLLVLLNSVGAQPFAGPVRAGPGPPTLAAEAVLIPFRPQPFLHCLQAVLVHVLAELEAPGQAAFALGPHSNPRSRRAAWGWGCGQVLPASSQFTIGALDGVVLGWLLRWVM